jgi:uncharacterized protein (DUF2252 family)
MQRLGTLKERIAAGRAARKNMSRSEQEILAPRGFDALKLLAESMRGRVRTLVPLKYERMRLSPFGYFRGAVPVMAADLAASKHSNLFTQICGDAHVLNLGAYAAQDGRLVFDINDFDETICGPFEWDLKRMSTSLLLAAEEARSKPPQSAVKEYGKISNAWDAVQIFLESYCAAIHRFAGMPVVELAHFQIHRLSKIDAVQQIFAKAERMTPLHARDQLTEAKGKTRIFRVNAPVLTRLQKPEAKRVLASLKSYADHLLPERRHFFVQYTPKDLAFKVVGTGSVGWRDYCIYFEGSGVDDPLFLQIKEEPQSAYQKYLPAAPALSEGERVAEGQRAMQFASDPFLGWTSFGGRDYLVRQLKDHKASITVADLKGNVLDHYAELAGELLARGHARAGDALVISGYIGTSKNFATAIAAFAEQYAERTIADWTTLCARQS